MNRLYLAALLLAAGCAPPEKNRAADTADFDRLCAPATDAAALRAFDPEMPIELPHFYHAAEAQACAKAQHKRLLLYFTPINTRSTWEPERNWFGDGLLLQKINRRYVPAFLYTDHPRYGDANMKLLMQMSGTNTQPCIVLADTAVTAQGLLVWPSGRPELEHLIDSLNDR